MRYIRDSGARLGTLFSRRTPVVYVEGIIRPAVLHDILPREATDALALAMKEAGQSHLICFLAALSGIG